MKRVWASLGLISVAVVALYLLGIFVRGHYGIAVTVHNLSGQSLREVRVKVEPKGEDHNLGALSDQDHARVFVRARKESHIALQYTDATGPHVQPVVGYIESGYCGKAEVKILPEGKVTSIESIDPVLCKKSWLDFM